MSTGTKEEQKKDQLKTAIRTLAIELELKEGRRFNVAKGVEEIARILKFSSQSEDDSVLASLGKVVALLSGKQIDFFRTKGIDLSVDELEKRLAAKKHEARQEVLYRGKKQESAANTETSESEGPPGKKKIVYRGQVTWV
jgi:hypothetical protein